MSETLVSVIMPAYNAARTIKAAVESVLAQTYNNWELMVVNDGSVDDTAAIIAEYAHANKKIKVVSLEKNGGLPAARNAGVNASTGELVAFLDSDDVWLPEKLKVQVAYHTENKEITISHTDFDLLVNENVINQNKHNITNRTHKKEGDLLPQLFYKNNIGILTVMVKREAFLNENGFDPKLWTFEDQDLWLRMAKNQAVFGYIPTVLAHYRINPEGITSKIARYKKAYRTFIQKHENSFPDGTTAGNVWGMYYRYFGAVYYKNKCYRISKLYFIKSLKINNLIFINLTTIIYIPLSWLKQQLNFK